MIYNDENIIVKKENGVEFIQFRKLLELGIKHAYTLKGDGLNFRSTAKEQDESYRKIFEAIGLDAKTKVKPNQRHTSNTRCIDSVADYGNLTNVDGIITDKKDIALTTTNADCILFFMYDPVKKVIANVHSGWKGTFQKIGEKTIIKMQTNYGCRPEDILIFINPSIRKCHFEVDEDVKELCKEIFGFTKRTNEFIFEGEVKDSVQKYYIDTVKINRILFENLRIKEENIIDCEICSVCNKDKVHSYRAEGKDFKLATAIISL